MEKISAENLAVLTEVPGVLRALGEDRDYWRGVAEEAKVKLAEISHKERLTKVASEMTRKGVDAGRTQEELISFLEKKASEGRLDVIEEAISMSAAQVAVGELTETPGQGLSDLEAFLIGEMA
jgi:hypothetical protein